MRAIHSLLLLCFCLIGIGFTGCADDQPQKVEMTDEALDMYSEYDKDFQQTAGQDPYKEAK